LLCFYVNWATFGNSKYWFRGPLLSGHPLLGSFPNTLARTHKFSGFYKRANSEVTI
jgi:hypothetical protein